MFVSYATAHLCKMQHDWLTVSQHPLQFQSLINISTLSNALINNREELWLAESDIPPLREKCSGQAGLPGSLPPCAETLAGEDASGQPYMSDGRTHVTFDVLEDRNAPFLLRKTNWWCESNGHQLSRTGENVAVAHLQHRKEVLWAWSCILRIGNPRIHLWQRQRDKDRRADGQTDRQTDRQTDI